MSLEELKGRFAGKVGMPLVLEVEKGAIKRYAVAVDDLNPFYLEEEYVRASPYRSIQAPPGFYGFPVKQPAPMFFELVNDLLKALDQEGFPNVLDGGIDMEFLAPICSGDILVSQQKVVDMRSRIEGGKGKLVLSTIESTYMKQDGSLVAKTRQLLISLPSQG